MYPSTFHFLLCARFTVFLSRPEGAGQFERGPEDDGDAPKPDTAMHSYPSLGEHKTVHPDESTASSSDAAEATQPQFVFTADTEGGLSLASANADELPRALKTCIDKTAQQWTTKSKSQWLALGAERNEAMVDNDDDVYCVDRRLIKHGSVWNGERSVHACRHCVRDGKPCFTCGREGFVLLSLHPEDRFEGVVEDFLGMGRWIRSDRLAHNTRAELANEAEASADA